MNVDAISLVLMTVYVEHAAVLISGDKTVEITAFITRSSAVADRLCDTSCH